MLNEAAIIAQLKTAFPDNIGDDAAVFACSEHESYVITQDLLIESIHFNRRYCDPLSLAHKSLHVNLSDVAAMGATPLFVLLGLSIPIDYEPELPSFLQAFTQACLTASVLLIGGDTTKSPDKLFISVTVIGKAPTNQIKYRHSAQPQDKICLIGNKGPAHLGLTALEANIPGLTSFKSQFLSPEARVQEGLWLAKQPHVHAMMDVSDGLFIDLKRLCEASNQGAEINLDHFTRTKEFTAACQQLNLDPLTVQLTGGEDYGLLLTIDEQHYEHIAAAFTAQFATPLTLLGSIKSSPGITLLKNAKPYSLDLSPFSHFGEL